jgi:hypothetical protein
VKNFVKNWILLFGLLVLGLVSCKKGDNTPVDFAYEYYPLNVGHYVIYDVLEVRHDVQATIQRDTSKYQLKIVIGDTILDLQNDIANRFFRYTRSSESDPWQIKDVWTTKISGNRAELVEENQRVIKLVFAPTADKNWDANAFNPFDPLDCFYADLHAQKIVNGQSFASTLVVEQEDFFSLIDHRRKYEVYAKGVGLVKKFYKHHEIMNFDTLDIRKGNEIHYNLIEFGQE